MLNGKELGAAIDAARIKKGITKKALAEHFKVKGSSVHEWITQGTIAKERINELINFFSDVADLGYWGIEATPAPQLRPVVTWNDEEELAPEEYVFIPRLAIEGSCGNGKMIWHVDEKGQRNAFRRSWALRNKIDPDHSATCMADGDSMRDRIMHGDSLVLNLKETKISSGKVYSFIFKDQHFIKRLFIMDERRGIRVVSDNPDKKRHADWFIWPDEENELQIIGRVAGVSGGM